MEGDTSGLKDFLELKTEIKWFYNIGRLRLSSQIQELNIKNKKDTDSSLIKIFFKCLLLLHKLIDIL